MQGQTQRWKKRPFSLTRGLRLAAAGKRPDRGEVSLNAPSTWSSLAAHSFPVSADPQARSLSGFSTGALKVLSPESVPWSGLL